MKNSTSLVVIILLLVILAILGYFWYKSQLFQPTVQPAATLPDIEPLTNPLEKKPDINPISKTNPFQGLYQNPFE